jgi:hypothetical protein
MALYPTLIIIPILIYPSYQIIKSLAFQRIINPEGPPVLKCDTNLTNFNWYEAEDAQSGFDDSRERSRFYPWVCASMVGETMGGA